MLRHAPLLGRSIAKSDSKEVPRLQGDGQEADLEIRGSLCEKKLARKKERDVILLNEAKAMRNVRIAYEVCLDLERREVRLGRGNEIHIISIRDPRSKASSEIMQEYCRGDHRSCAMVQIRVSVTGVV